MTLNDFLITHSARTVKDEYISSGIKEIANLKDSAYKSQLQPSLNISPQANAITNKVSDSTTKFMASIKILQSAKTTFLYKVASYFNLFNKKIPQDLV